MNDKKVIFFDIDGTLLTPGKRIVEQSTIETLQYLSQREDVDLFISSGRGKETLNEIKHILPYFKGLNLANGGQLIIDNQEILFPFEYDEVQQFVAYLNTHQISYVIMTNCQNLRRYFREDIRRGIDAEVKCEYQLITSDDNFYFNDVIEFWILDNNDIIDGLKALFPNLTFFNWGNFGCDVVPNGRNKATGVKKIIELMNYNYDLTYAIGDSDNDVPMFQAVATSIAMNNGSTKAKNTATFVTDNIENDGVKKAVYNYIINNK